jgi:ATP-binding cassette, subfamily B (MDR/TAP), member 1
LEISGDLNVGKVINVLFAILIGCMSIVQMAPRIQAFTSCQTLRRVPSIDSFDEGGEKPEHIEGNIEFKNVSFVYPSRPEGYSPSQSH